MCVGCVFVRVSVCVKLKVEIATLKLPLQQTIDQKSYVSNGDSHLLNCCINVIL